LRAKSPAISEASVFGGDYDFAVVIPLIVVVFGLASLAIPTMAIVSNQSSG
jgi:hypothetical protein